MSKEEKEKKVQAMSSMIENLLQQDRKSVV